MKIEKWFCDKCKEEMLPKASTGSGTVTIRLLHECKPGCFGYEEADYLLCEKCAKELEKWLKETEINVEISLSSSISATSHTSSEKAKNCFAECKKRKF